MGSESILLSGDNRRRIDIRTDPERDAGYPMDSDISEFLNAKKPGIKMRRPI